MTEYRILLSSVLAAVALHGSEARSLRTFSVAFRRGLAVFMLWPLLAFPGGLAEAIVFPAKRVERILPEYRSLPVLASDVSLARLLAEQPAGAVDFGKGLRTRLPDSADVALFMSYDSLMATNHHTPFSAAHAVIAYAAGAWYRFVDEGAIDRGHDLRQYKVIVVPYAPIERGDVVNKLLDAGRAGATLIIGDPLAFSNDRDGTELKSWRSSLLGNLKVGEPFWSYAGDILTSPVKTDGALHVPRQLRAQSIRNATDMQTILRYKDGRAAAVRKKFGKGEVILFGFNALSFRNAYDKAWASFFRSLFSSVGVELDHPLWRLKLPLPESMQEKEDEAAEVCLTGNHVRWERNRPRFFGSFNVGGRYRYSLKPDVVPDEGGDTGWIPFIRGDLCDRHSCHAVLPRFSYRNHRNWIVSWNEPGPLTITVDLMQEWKLERAALVIADYVPDITIYTSRDSEKWGKESTRKGEGKTTDIIRADLTASSTARYLQFRLEPRPVGSTMTIAEMEVWADPFRVHSPK